MINRIIFLSTIAAIGVISATLCAPALPFIADHFSARFSEVQFTISLFLLGNAFGQFISGPLSDQIGQRKVLLGGLFLYIIASCSCAIASHMSILLIARFFQGTGSSVGPVLARAIASNSFPKEKSAQVQSYNAIGVGVASILAILCSGQITLISWRGNFWLAVFLGVILFLWAIATLTATSETTSSKISLKKGWRQMKQIFLQPRFLIPTFCHSMTYGMMYGYITLFPFLLIERFHKNDPALVGIYSAYMIGFYMLGAFLASRLIMRMTSYRLMILGILLQLISGALLFFTHSNEWFFTALSIFNISIGLILPLTSASALAPFVGQAVGTASSSLGLSYRLIGAMLSTVICQLPSVGGKNLGVAIFLLSLISLGIFRLLPTAASQKL